MTDKNETPLRGDAAWQAAKQGVAARNKAAHERGREKRAEDEQKVQDGRRAADRRDAASLPEQPGRD